MKQVLINDDTQSKVDWNADLLINGGTRSKVGWNADLPEPGKTSNRAVVQDGKTTVNRRKAGSRPRRIVAENEDNSLEISDFIDPEYWKVEKLCCGTVFRGLNEEMLIDNRFMRPCTSRLGKANDLKRSGGSAMDVVEEDIDVEITSLDMEP